MMQQEEGVIWSEADQDPDPGSAANSCVIWGKKLNLFKPGLPHLSNWNDDVQFLGTPGEMMCIKHLARCLTYSGYSVSLCFLLLNDFPLGLRGSTSLISGVIQLP